MVNSLAARGARGRQSRSIVVMKMIKKHRRAVLGSTQRVKLKVSVLREFKQMVTGIGDTGRSDMSIGELLGESSKGLNILVKVLELSVFDIRSFGFRHERAREESCTNLSHGDSNLFSEP